MARKTLTKAQIDESMRFGDGALAAAGHFVDRPETRLDARRVLRGELSPEEAISLAVRRIKR